MFDFCMLSFTKENQILEFVITLQRGLETMLIKDFHPL